MTTSTINVSPLTPAIGAEIGNVDLGQVTDQEIADIRVTQAQSGVF
jgi:alpha-ketoglutarate-dependent taurine dioxygenase